jgi:hypothetical protein
MNNNVWLAAIPAEPLRRVVDDVVREVTAADLRTGGKHLPDGTPEHIARMGAEKAAAQARRTADMFRRVTIGRAASGALTWWDVLRAGVYDVGADTDPATLRADLIQVAAVAMRWVQDIDRGPDRPTVVPADPGNAEPDSRERKLAGH